MRNNSQRLSLLDRERSKDIFLIDLAKARDGTQLIQNVVHDEPQEETLNIREIVDLLAASRDPDIRVDGVGEARQGGGHADEPGDVRAPVEAVVEPVDTGLGRNVQVRQLELAVAHDPEIAHHHADHGAQEHRVGIQDVDEGVGGVVQLPGVDHYAQDGGDEGPASDVDPFREERGDVEAAGPGVVDGVDGQLGDEEAEAGEEGGGAGFGRVAVLHPADGELGGGPEELAVDLLRGGGGEGAHEGDDQTEEDGAVDLAGDLVAGALGEAVEVGLVGQGDGDAADDGRDAVDHAPGALRGCAESRVDDEEGTAAVGGGEGPDGDREHGDCGGDVCVAENNGGLLRWDAEEWDLKNDKDDEADELGSCHVG